MRKLMWGVMALLAIGSAWALFVLNPPNQSANPKNVVENYIAAFQFHDPKAAMAYLRPNPDLSNITYQLYAKLDKSPDLNAIGARILSDQSTQTSIAIATPARTWAVVTLQSHNGQWSIVSIQ